MAESYGAFALYYDALTQNVDYPARAAMLDALIRKHWSADLQACAEDRALLLDLACGTGSFSEAMAALDWDVIGVDRSEDMLMRALDKRYDSPCGERLQYLCQDMRQLDLYGTVSVTLCMLDSLNHLPTVSDVRRVFSRISLFTNPGGLLLFDVNTEYKHRQILAEQCFVYELPDAFCTWQNRLENHAPHYPVTIQLDFFEAIGKEQYSRMTERFTEQIYPHALLMEMLNAADFSLLELLDGDTFTAPTQQTQRLLYILRKGV